MTFYYNVQYEFPSLLSCKFNEFNAIILKVKFEGINFNNFPSKYEYYPISMPEGICK